MLRLYPLAVSLKGARARNAERQVSTLEQQKQSYVVLRKLAISLSVLL